MEIWYNQLSGKENVFWDCLCKAILGESELYCIWQGLRFTTEDEEHNGFLSYNSDNVLTVLHVKKKG